MDLPPHLDHDLGRCGDAGGVTKLSVPRTWAPCARGTRRCLRRRLGFAASPGSSRTTPARRARTTVGNAKLAATMSLKYYRTSHISENVARRWANRTHPSGTPGGQAGMRSHDVDTGAHGPPSSETAVAADYAPRQSDPRLGQPPIKMPPTNRCARSRAGGSLIGLDLGKHGGARKQG